MSDLSDFEDEMKMDVPMIISQKVDTWMDVNSQSTSTNNSALTQPFKPPAILKKSRQDQDQDTVKTNMGSCLLFSFSNNSKPKTQDQDELHKASMKTCRMLDQAVKTRAGAQRDLHKFNNSFNRRKPHDFFSFSFKFTPYFNKYKSPFLTSFRSKLLDFSNELQDQAVSKVKDLLRETISATDGTIGACESTLTRNLSASNSEELHSAVTQAMRRTKKDASSISIPDL